MLSNETKLYRINEKLATFNANLQFGCFDLKSYQPVLYNKYKDNRFYFGNGLIQVWFRLRTVNNKVEIHISELGLVRFDKPEDFEFYMASLKELKQALDYCNNLGLEIPVYEG